MTRVPTTDLIGEFLAEHSGKQFHIKEVADRFNLFTHGAALPHECLAVGIPLVMDTGV